MGFRDENDALRANRDALKTELEDVREKAARAEELESANAALRAENEALARNVEKLEGPKKGPSVAVPIAVASGVFVTVVGAVFFFLLAAEPHPAPEPVALSAERQVAMEEVTIAEAAERTLARVAAEEAERLAIFEPVVRPGQVESVSGQAPVAIGDRCTLTVIPNRSQVNCRVSLRCAEKELYQIETGGFLVCGIENGQVTYGEDVDANDVDPALVLDLVGGRVSIRNESGADWGAEVLLRAAQPAEAEVLVQ